MSRPSCMWIADVASRSMETNATRHAPDETGGVLLGYWAAGTGEAVVTCVIGPGPGAGHSESTFVPDYDYQEAEIARLYEESNRQLQYLGDWHSHPGGGGTLSKLDRRTLRSIGRATEARVLHPIMVVLSGVPQWSIHGWQHEHRGWWPCRRAIAREVSVRIFSANRVQEREH